MYDSSHPSYDDNEGVNFPSQNVSWPNIDNIVDKHY